MLATKGRAYSNSHVVSWVNEMAKMCKPDQIYWCDGSEAEAKALLDEAIATGVLIPLSSEKRPNSYLHRSNPNDVARTEELTFVCTPTKAEAGPTNNWMEPADAYRKLAGIFDGAMKGRTMYVVPYVMGAADSPFAKVGIELTDSIYVVLNMRMMARMGQIALARLGASDDFNRGLHSVADCDPERRFICHFPQDDTIWSVGSGYGGNALLGKKCLALRIASYQARNEGWLAEHMMLLEAESPEGETHFVAGAFPSASGKTNLAMLVPPPALGGWKIRTVGDDIAWMRVGADGRLYAVNPEFGFFGVAPGTNYHTNPNAMRTLERNAFFTNVAVTPDNDVWWEGIDGEVPERLTDWRGRPWTKGSREYAAHPNSRFTAQMANNPALSRFAESDRRRGDDRGHDGYGRRGSPGPDGDARVLRLRHGDVLRALARDVGAHPRSTEALHRELVSQGRRRHVPVARLWREHAGPRVDHRPFDRSRGCDRDARRLGAAPERSPSGRARSRARTPGRRASRRSG